LSCEKLSFSELDREISIKLLREEGLFFFLFFLVSAFVVIIFLPFFPLFFFLFFFFGLFVSGRRGMSTTLERVDNEKIQPVAETTFTLRQLLCDYSDLNQLDKLRAIEELKKGRASSTSSFGALLLRQTTSGDRSTATNSNADSRTSSLTTSRNATTKLLLLSFVFGFLLSLFLTHKHTLSLFSSGSRRNSLKDRERIPLAYGFSSLSHLITLSPFITRCLSAAHESYFRLQDKHNNDNSQQQQQ
jgi:hypothetical protein